MSSRSSSEAASSLRLVKISTMPWPIAEEERDRPESQAREPARACGSTRRPRFAAACRRRDRRGAGGGRAIGLGAAEQPRSKPAWILRAVVSGCRQPRPNACPQDLLDAARLGARRRRSASYRPMTPEETRARLLYRDGLMLVLDKPAGLAVHRGPKGGASLEDDFDALRFGLPRNPALAHRLDRDTAGCLVLGRHHKALEKLGLAVQAGQDRQDLLGGRRRRPGERRGPDRPAARPARRQARLVDEGRSRRPAVADALAGRGARRHGAARPIAWLELRAADRAHPSIARPLRRAGLADPRRRDLWRSAPTSPLQLLARRVVVPLAEDEAADRRRGAGAPRMREALAACGFAGDPPPAEGQPMRLARPSASSLFVLWRQRGAISSNAPGRNRIAMPSLDQLPRINLLHAPTPLEPLPRLSAALGGPQLWVKRDDCTGLALGGNKARKLEYLLGEALAQGADTVITAAASIQSCPPDSSGRGPARTAMPPDPHRLGARTRASVSDERQSDPRRSIRSPDRIPAWRSGRGRGNSPRGAKIRGRRAEALSPSRSAAPMLWE